MSSHVIRFTGMISDDAKTLLINYPDQLKADYTMLAGYAIEGEIRKLRSTRSIRQNAWLHSFLGGDKGLAQFLGYTLEELKLVGLVALWGTHEVMGMTLPVKPRTSKLTTEEFSDLCEWFVQKAAEVDFLVLYPEEFKRKKKAQQRKAATAA